MQVNLDEADIKVLNQVAAMEKTLLDDKDK